MYAAILASQTLRHSAVMLSALARHLPEKYTWSLTQLSDLVRYLLAGDRDNLRFTLEELDGYDERDQRARAQFVDAVRYIAETVPSMSADLTLTVLALIESWLQPLSQAEALAEALKGRAQA